MRCLWPFALIIVAPLLAQATTIRVPADQPTIQAGINSATEGDTILVADGVFTGPGNKNIAIEFTSVTIISEHGPQTTIIDCEDDGRAFSIRNVTASGPIIDGFTLRNGAAGNQGSGIEIFNSSPLIRNCIFTDNVADYGGAIYASGNIEKSNQHPQMGEPVIEGCTFAYNTATISAAVLFSEDNINPSFQQCVLYGNLSPAGAPIQGSTVTLQCSNVYGNIPGDWVGDIFDQAATNDNSSLDPAFCDRFNGSYSLCESSPCLATNSPCGSLVGALALGCDCSTSGNPAIDPIGPQTVGELALLSFDITANDPEGPKPDLYAFALPDGATFTDNNGGKGLFEWVPNLSQAGEYSVWFYAAIGPAVTFEIVTITVSNSGATTIHVTPTGNDSTGIGTELNPFATIQHAIDVASTWDKVFVHDGLYTGSSNRDIDFAMKSIFLVSENGPAATIIDCQDSGRAFSIRNVPPPGPIINGFTVTNGSAGNQGGAMEIFNCSPLVLNCLFDNNQANYGGAVYVTGNPIKEAWDDPAAFPIFLNCTFVNNSATISAAVLYSEVETNPGLQYCILYGNTSPDGAVIRGSWVSLQCCDIYGNLPGDWIGDVAGHLGTGGNFSADPDFCDASNADLSISDGSACAPGGNACGNLIGALDVGCSCCRELLGNVALLPHCNAADQTVDVIDLTTLIDHLFINLEALCCQAEADVHPAIIGESADGFIDVADLTALVDHLFLTFPTLPNCP